MSVKFRLSKNEEKNVLTEKTDSVEKMKELNKKIEEHILSDELKNLKIDRNVTERKRASIFDDSKAKPRNEKKNETSNKIVLDSTKVKKATEIKLKKIQHVTGLLEKYDIPNPFEKYYKDSIDYSQLMGQNNNAKLFNLALTVIIYDSFNNTLCNTYKEEYFLYVLHIIYYLFIYIYISIIHA